MSSSGVWGWFGGKAAQQTKDAPKKAILELRMQLDTLQKREKHLETQISQQQSIAKTNAGKNKEMAIRALKRKKQHETALIQTSNQINVLEDQIYTIESANINKETLQAMKNAGSAMKTIHNGMNIDKVDDIMEGLREQQELANEINQAITQPAYGNDITEDELADELEELEQENLDEQMLKTGSVPVLPTGPSKEPVQKNKPVVEEEDEEAELRKLQAEMAI